MNKKNHSVNVLMDDLDYEKLDVLAQRLIISRGELLRELLRHAHTMVIQEQPTCANGQICYSPQLHPRRQVPERPAASGTHSPV